MSKSTDRFSGEKSPRAVKPEARSAPVVEKCANNARSSAKKTFPYLPARGSAQSQHVLETGVQKRERRRRRVESPAEEEKRSESSLADTRTCVRFIKCSQRDF